jgi:hypothetical protein
MFQELLETHIDALIDNAKKSHHAQLHVYDIIYKHIQAFVNKHPLVISSNPNEDLYSFKIYGAYIFEYANMLANELAQFTSYVRLNTDVRNKEFTIIVDGVRMVYMHNMEPNFMKIMTSAINANKSTLSPEVELIDIYHRIYSPNVCSARSILIQHESILWKSFNDARQTIITRPVIKGGSEHTDVVLEWLKGRSGCVVIGDAAVALLSNGTKHHSNTVQFIAANPKHAIDQLKKYMQEFIGLSVSVKKYDMNMPDDYRIRKFVLSSNVNGITYYIANIFNSAFYELIPFTSIATFNVATFPVILRFMFADIWFLRVLRFFNMITQKRYVSNMNVLYSNIDIMRSGWLDDIKQVQNCFPMYIGTYISESTSKKKSGTVFPYYPAKCKIDTGEYRLIGRND